MPGAMQSIGFMFELNAKSAMDTAFKFGSMIGDIDDGMKKLATTAKRKVQPRFEKGWKFLKKSFMDPRFRKVVTKRKFREMQLQFGKLGRAGQKMDEVLGTAWSNQIKQMLKFSAVLGGLVAFVKAAADVDTQLGKVRMTSQLTRKEMELTEKAIMDTASKYGDSVREVTEMAIFAGQAKIRGKAMDEFVDAGRLMANVTGMATEQIGQFNYHLTKMHGFTGQLAGMASQWKYMTDTLEVSNETLSGFFDKGIRPLLNTVPKELKNKVVPELAAMAGVFSDSFGDPQELRQMLMDATQLDSQTGMKVRAQIMKGLGLDAEGMQKLVKEGNFREMMKGIALSAQDIPEGKFNELQQTFSDLFATSKDTMLALRTLDMGSFDKTLDDIVAKSADASYANERFADATVRLTKRWSKFKTEMSLVMKTLGAPIFDIFKAVVFKITEYLKGANDWFKELSPGAKKVVSIVGALVVVFGALSLLLAGVVPILWSITAAMLANPVGLIIAGVATLVVGIVLLAKHWDALWGKVKEVMGPWVWLIAKVGRAIGEWIGQSIAWVADMFTRSVSWMGDQIANLWGAIRSGAQVIWDMLVNPFSEGAKHWTAFFDAIITGVKTLMKGIVNLMIGGLNTMIRAANSGLDWIPGLGGDTIPEIPALRTGGLIKGSPDGTLVRAGEANRDEIIAPLDKAGVAGEESVREIVEKLDWLGRFLVANLSTPPVAAPTGPRSMPAGLNAANQAALSMGG